MDMNNNEITRTNNNLILVKYLSIRDTEHLWLRSKRLNTLAGEILRLMYYRHITGYNKKISNYNLGLHFYSNPQPIVINKALNKAINLGYILRNEYTNKTHYTLTANFIKEYKKVLSLD